VLRGQSFTRFRCETPRGKSPIWVYRWRAAGIASVECTLEEAALPAAHRPCALMRAPVPGLTCDAERRDLNRHSAVGGTRDGGSHQRKKNEGALRASPPSLVVRTSPDLASLQRPWTFGRVVSSTWAATHIRPAQMAARNYPPAHVAILAVELVMAMRAPVFLEVHFSAHDQGPPHGMDHRPGHAHSPRLVDPVASPRVARLRSSSAKQSPHRMTIHAVWCRYDPVRSNSIAQRACSQAGADTLRASVIGKPPFR